MLHADVTILMQCGSLTNAIFVWSPGVPCVTGYYDSKREQRPGAIYDTIDGSLMSEKDSGFWLESSRVSSGSFICIFLGL